MTAKTKIIKNKKKSLEEIRAHLLNKKHESDDTYLTFEILPGIGKNYDEYMLHKDNYQRFIIKELLEGKGSQESLNNSLSIAVYHDDLNLVKLLLYSGADINDSDYMEERSCLSNACYNNNFPIAKLLIELGANVNADGGGPLNGAVMNNNMSMIELLKEHGVNYNTKYDFNHPLLEAAVNNHFDLFKYFIEEEKVKIPYNFMSDFRFEVKSKCDLGIKEFNLNEYNDIITYLFTHDF